MFGRDKIKLQLHHQLALLEGMPTIYTPDIAKLEQYETQRLFVADEWMSDRRHNFVLDDLGAKREGAAFTENKFNFRIFEGFIDREWTPVALEDEKGFVVKGEIVSISPSNFLLLDKLKQNRVKFIRVRTKVLKPYRDRIVFENTTEERGPHATLTGGVDWLTGKFPHGHPLAGKKYWVGPERLTEVACWMYVGAVSWWRRYKTRPYLFSKVPTFKPKKDKDWLSEYYKYQNPKDC